MEPEYYLHDHLLQLEEKLLRQDVRKNAANMAELLADEFIEFGSSGQVYSKEQIIESLRQEEPAQWSMTEFNSTLLAPGVALVTYRAFQSDEHGIRSGSSLRCSIWKLQGGQWKMLFHQGTPSKQARCKPVRTADTIPPL